MTFGAGEAFVGVPVFATGNTLEKLVIPYRFHPKVNFLENKFECFIAVVSLAILRTYSDTIVADIEVG